MPQKHVNEIYKAIQSAVSNLNDALPKVQNQVAKDLELLLKELELLDGNVRVNVKNLRTIAKLRGKIESAISGNDLYQTHVGRYLTSFNDINRLQQSYFDRTFDGFEPSTLLKELQKQTIAATTASLTRSGVSVNLVDPITDILRKNVTTGTSYFDLVQQMKDYIAGDAENLGHLGKYVRQITTDALNQYSAQYMEIVSNDLNLSWFQYTAPLKDSSRDLCIALVGKRFYHKRELPQIVKGDFKEFKEIDGKIYKKTGLPEGMIPGTNSENFNTFRGGYNCDHQPIPVSEGVVPKEQRIETYERLGIEYDSQGFELAA